MVEMTSLARIRAAVEALRSAKSSWSAPPPRRTRIRCWPRRPSRI